MLTHLFAARIDPLIDGTAANCHYHRVGGCRGGNSLLHRQGGRREGPARSFKKAAGQMQAGEADDATVDGI